MLIDTKNVIESLKKSPHAKEIIASLAEKLEITKDDKKLSAWTTPMDRTPSG
jgi:hypothetical protein